MPTPPGRHKPEQGACQPCGATPSGIVREGDWKLIEHYEDGRLEPYDLKDDLSDAKPWPKPRQK